MVDKAVVQIRQALSSRQEALISLFDKLYFVINPSIIGHKTVEIKTENIAHVQLLSELSKWLFFLLFCIGFLITQLYLSSAAEVKPFL